MIEKIMRENLSTHITYKEATRSMEAKRLGIDNTPDDEQWERMKLLAVNVFEPLRIYFDYPIFIWSIFRSEVINANIRGASKNSQHMANNGAAMDIDADIFGGLTNREIFDYVRKNLEFDQLIGEGMNVEDFDWIHISYNKVKNRKEVLTMVIQNGLPVYKKFINP
jgi:zinc D-Ala-D-Ala carboxypeptidase